MKKFIIKAFTIAGLAGMVLMQTGCKKDYNDPNRANEDLAFSTKEGLTGVVIGLQRTYTLGRASTLYNRITINGLTTNELIVVNPGNTAEVQLAAGGNTVDGNHTMLTTMWSSCNKVVFDANRVIAAANNLADKNYASGLVAYATIFKALSIADMSEFWEKVPSGTGANVSFIDRIDGYKAAITAIDGALTAIAANAISASFITNAPAGIDIINTLHALKARFSLAAGLYTQAMAEANLVSTTIKSNFNFDALSLNPVFEVSTSTNNVVQPKDSTMGLQPVALEPALSDGRVPFYMVKVTTVPRFRLNGFFNLAAAPIPVYLPGEMILIKAECYARQAAPDLVNGIVELNKVVTKNNDIYGVNANQPPAAPATIADLLLQIYRHRCIELFMSGLKLEDMRRFARPNAERKRNLMPYPLRERDNNPNTPADPPF